MNPVFWQHRTDHGIFGSHHLPQAAGAVPVFWREENHQGDDRQKLILSVEAGKKLSTAVSLMALVLPVDSGCLIYLSCVLERIIEQVPHRGRIVNIILAFDAKEQIGCPLVLHGRQGLKQITVSLYRLTFLVCAIGDGKFCRIQLPQLFRVDYLPPFIQVKIENVREYTVLPQIFFCDGVRFSHYFSSSFILLN